MYVYFPDTPCTSREKQSDTVGEIGKSVATILKVAVFWDIMPRCVPTFQISVSFERSAHLHQTTQCHVLHESNLQIPFWVNKKLRSDGSCQLLALAL